MNAKQRKQFSDDPKGKTIESAEWCEDSDLPGGGYWVLTFKGDDSELCVLLVADVARAR